MADDELQARFHRFIAQVSVVLPDATRTLQEFLQFVPAEMFIADFLKTLRQWCRDHPDFRGELEALELGPAHDPAKDKQIMALVDQMMDALATTFSEDVATDARLRVNAADAAVIHRCARFLEYFISISDA